MILELPLRVADPTYWGAGDVSSEDLSKLICDGVSIRWRLTCGS
jgi:hypothetical protein